MATGREEEDLRTAARTVSHAGSLVVAAGAGMGVDSGLPDFRGDRGFWNAYPAYERLGLSFMDAANPVHFDEDPAFGWGFYGHRADLYRRTAPHGGFGILRAWGDRAPGGAFVVTSNVDGHFQKAGFPEERVCEVHGSLRHRQCTEPCHPALWENTDEVRVEAETMRALDIPRCPRCGAVARPNVLMFGDFRWVDARTARQRSRLDAFLESAPDPLVIVELGAGSAVPTIRLLSRHLGLRPGARVLRINPREPAIDPPHLSLPLGALEALTAIDRLLPEV
jgi:NAD-dependent SIR2 family protein deacetylase